MLETDQEARHLSSSIVIAYGPPRSWWRRLLDRWLHPNMIYRDVLPGYSGPVQIGDEDVKAAARELVRRLR